METNPLCIIQIAYFALNFTVRIKDLSNTIRCRIVKSTIKSKAAHERCRNFIQMVPSERRNATTSHVDIKRSMLGIFLDVFVRFNRAVNSEWWLLIVGGHSHKASFSVSLDAIAPTAMKVLSEHLQPDVINVLCPYLDSYLRLPSGAGGKPLESPCGSPILFVSPNVSWQFWKIETKVRLQCEFELLYSKYPHEVLISRNFST